jgi:hypothetical protein
VIGCVSEELKSGDAGKMRRNPTAAEGRDREGTISLGLTNAACCEVLGSQGGKIKIIVFRFTADASGSGVPDLAITIEHDLEDLIQVFFRTLRSTPWYRRL